MSIEIWTEPRKTALWKLFIARSVDYEQWLVEPLRGYFRAQLADVLQKLDRYGPRTEGLIAGWSRARVAQEFKRNPALGKAINIDPKTEATRLRELATPYIREIMYRYGKERMRDLLSRKTAIDFNVNDPAVLRWIGDRMMRFSRQVTGMTFAQVAQIVREGFQEGASLAEIAQRLRDKFASWDRYRAPLISRTETLSAMNRADLFAVEQAGLEKELKKHWLSSRDPHVRPTHLTAEQQYAKGIKIAEKFKVGQDTMLAPGLGSIPGENINCRCTLYYSSIAKE